MNSDRTRTTYVEHGIHAPQERFAKDPHILDTVGAVRAVPILCNHMAVRIPVYDTTMPIRLLALHVQSVKISLPQCWPIVEVIGDSLELRHIRVCRADGVCLNESRHGEVGVAEDALVEHRAVAGQGRR